MAINMLKRQRLCWGSWAGSLRACGLKGQRGAPSTLRFSVIFGLFITPITLIVSGRLSPPCSPVWEVESLTMELSCYLRNKNRRPLLPSAYMLIPTWKSSLSPPQAVCCMFAWQLIGWRGLPCHSGKVSINCRPWINLRHLLYVQLGRFTGVYTFWCSPIYSRVFLSCVSFKLSH